MRQPTFRLFVENHVQTSVGRVADGCGAEAREEAFHAFVLEDGGAGAEERFVGVEIGFIADFDHGDGHHDQAGGCAGYGTGGEVCQVGKLWERGGGGGGRARAGLGRWNGDDPGRAEEVGSKNMLAQSIERGEVQSRAKACADYGGKGAAPELAKGVRAAGDVAEG